MENKILMNLSKILVTFLAIYMGWGFWLSLMGGIVIVFPFMLGYIYIVVGLARSKKWANTIFLTSILASVSAWALVMFILDFRFNILQSLDSLLAIFTWISIVAMTIFGILALFRKLYNTIKISRNS